MKELLWDIERLFAIFGVRRTIRARYKCFFKIARRLRNLGKKEAKKLHWNQSELHFYSANVSAQTLHRLESIQTLVSKGLTADAWPILRSLIESVLDHDYILRNPEKLDLYFKYSIYLDLEYVKRIELRRPLSADEKAQQSKMRSEWKKSEHLFKTKSGGIRNAWRDKSLEEIGKEVKLTNIYSLAYREANDYVHGNSNLLREFVVGKNEEGLMLKAGGIVNEREILLITSLTLVLVFFVLMRANKCFDLGFDGEVKAIDIAITNCNNAAQKQGIPVKLG